jgi:hypothetical protein
VQSGHVIRPALPASKYFLTRKEKNDGGFKHPTSPILLQLLLSTTEGNARNCKYRTCFLLCLLFWLPTAVMTPSMLRRMALTLRRSPMLAQFFREDYNGI